MFSETDADDASPAGNLPIPRATIEQIVAWRNAAIDLYSKAFDTIVVADKALKEAAGMAARCHPGVNSYIDDQHIEELREFHRAVRLPGDRARYLRTARKLIDHETWAYIIERTDLERLMDHEAKNKLRKQMAYIPERSTRDRELIDEEEMARGLPEITVENIQATLQQFMLDADTIFRRGIANVFSKLDRRFRSHDGFKIGTRLILTNVFDSRWGGLNYGTIEDKLIDIERVFAVLDGRPQASFKSAIEELRYRSGRGSGPQQTECETDYFRIKGYKNGNAHLWFVRDDLVDKVNKLLAEYYGEVIGDARTKDADPFADVKHLPAKYFGFYPTPQAVVDEIFESRRWQAKGINILRKVDEPRLRILEPSAGTGNLARRCIRTAAQFTANFSRREEYLAEYLRDYRWDTSVDCVEIQPHLAHALEAEDIYNRVFCLDFLKLSPEVTGLYDLVVMNPPFDRERDIDHVMHAWTFLAPGGQLTAIMSAGTEFRDTKKSAAFRDFVRQLGGIFIDLPAGSFAETGTYVNTCYVQLRKPN